MYLCWDPLVSSNGVVHVTYGKTIFCLRKTKCTFTAFKYHILVVVMQQIEIPNVSNEELNFVGIRATSLIRNMLTLCKPHLTFYTPYLIERKKLTILDPPLHSCPHVTVDTAMFCITSLTLLLVLLILSYLVILQAVARGVKNLRETNHYAVPPRK
uniref:Uncharacterized protein n=1 Tax=Glossina palpalis gambiensis TaxID=67801 RepID=A0A1B0BRN6_9MUSC